MRWIKSAVAMPILCSLLLVSVAFAQQTQSTMSRASTMIGADVENNQGEDLGDIDDIVIDPQTGQVAYAVVSFGGFLGLGEKHYAVPFAALTHVASGQRIGTRERYLLNIDQERLRNAPAFERNVWPNMADRTWGEQLHAYYGVTPYWTAYQARASQSDSQRAAAAPGQTSGAMVMQGAALPAVVQSIDQDSRSIRLQTTNNEIVEMQAPAGLLGSLQAGDRVEVVIRKTTMAPQSVPPGQTGTTTPGTRNTR